MHCVLDSHLVISLNGEEIFRILIDGYTKLLSAIIYYFIAVCYTFRVLFSFADISTILLYNMCMKINTM